MSETFLKEIDDRNHGPFEKTVLEGKDEFFDQAKAIGAGYKETIETGLAPTFFAYGAIVTKRSFATRTDLRVRFRDQ